MNGTVSFDLIKPWEMWSNNKNLHMAYATVCQDRIVMCLTIFDIFYAGLVVTDTANKYLSMGWSDQKLRFIAIDPVAGAIAESSFIEEMGRITRIMIGREPNPV